MKKILILVPYIIVCFGIIGSLSTLIYQQTMEPNGLVLVFDILSVLGLIFITFFHHLKFWP